MITPATRLRRQLADRIAVAYTAAGAEAVLLGGSVGRGEADRHSDIELGVFWREPPTEEQRTDAIAAAGGDVHYLWPYAESERAWFDDWFVGRRDDVPKSGIVVEPVHMTLADAEQTIVDLVERFDPALEKQVLGAALVTGIPLTRDLHLPRLRDAVGAYPDGLARAVVEKYAQIEHVWRLAAFRERDNPLRLAAETVRVLEGCLHALLAVNRCYWYGFKWLDGLAVRFEHAPHEFVARLRAVYGARPDEIEPLVTSLVDDTYDLVERHVSGVDVERLRRLFRYRRPLWDAETP